MAQADIKKVLAEADADHDGLVNADEVKAICIKLNLDAILVPCIVRAYDANDDGKITLAEFEQFWAERHSADKQTLFRRLFEKIDSNKSGFIEVAEMMEFTALVGEPTTREEAEEQLQSLDSDGDGKVSYKELWSVFEDIL